MVLLVRRYLDDALDVFGVHGVGGITGFDSRWVSLPQLHRNARWA
ncbi:hypothetical protein LNQ03_22705 [Klebsiella pneumoniae subsp. pneumoniae]|nr:hypothetical protein [Klebsiella pneumoniae subsp. pneumoniae]